MSKVINIYCDESCHLENDKQGIIALGAVWCDKSIIKKVAEDIKKIKTDYGISPFQELKWTKIAPSNSGLYEDIINYFFESRLNFRGLILKDKDKLDYNINNIDSFYYKMYYYLIVQLIEYGKNYNIYLDVKDTKGYEKIIKLREVISKKFLDFDQTMIKNIQEIKSYESQIMQITDILLGAVSYFNRNLNTSKTKNSLIDLIKEKSLKELNLPTLWTEKKFNLFFMSPDLMKKRSK